MDYLNISKSMFRHYREVFWPHIDFVVFLFLLIIFRHFRERNLGRSSVFLAVNFILPNAPSSFFIAKLSAVRFIFPLLAKLSIELKYSRMPCPWVGWWRRAQFTILRHSLVFLFFVFFCNPLLFFFWQIWAIYWWFNLIALG